MKSARATVISLAILGSLLVLGECSFIGKNSSTEVSHLGNTRQNLAAGNPDAISSDDKRIHDQALAEQDPDTCGDIKNTTYKKECTDRVLFMQASAKGDASFCANIVDPAQKQSCADNVLFNLAGEKLDEKLCLQISNAAQKTLCQESVKGMKEMKKAQAAGKSVLPQDTQK